MRNLEAEFARVAGLTAMGALAASIIHEIRQPLAAIGTNGSACLRWLNRDEPDLYEAREAVARIVRDSKRAADVVRTLRALALKSGPDLVRFDLEAAIREVLTIMQNELRGHHVLIETELFAGDRPVIGDRTQLQQVLLNLVTNGIEAMIDVTDRARILVIRSELTDAGEALVAVADTGTGLDPGVADRIFATYVTTKADGMGMGLSICSSIIEAHGGRLWASPRKPYGTTFTFIVPAMHTI